MSINCDLLIPYHSNTVILSDLFCIMLISELHISFDAMMLADIHMQLSSYLNVPAKVLFSCNVWYPDMMRSSFWLALLHHARVWNILFHDVLPAVSGIECLILCVY